MQLNIHLRNTGEIPAETLAVIDLGTNTFHLLIVELLEGERYLIKEKYKEVVKLGEGGINAGTIAPPAFDRGMHALRRFRKIIDSRQVTKVVACGTSALRSAENGPLFQEMALRETGIDIRIINGNEEALLIYKGVRSGVPFSYDEHVLLVDIGGGSVEFIVADHQQAKLLRSLKLGAARMWERIQPSDPITPKQLEHLRSIIADQLDELLEEIREFNVRRIIGSSGSFETIAALIAHESGDMLSKDNVNGYRFDRKKFKKVHQRLTTVDRKQRLAMGGMEPARVDLIVMSSVIIDYVLAELKVENVTVSGFALKEGILREYIETGRERQHNDAERNIRLHSVQDLAMRFQADLAHGERVGQLALQLFDQLRAQHGYGEEERELLHYAAILHDIGYFVNRSGHHKHGQYIVMNSGMKGFSTNELFIISNIVRYHRKSLPTREHFHYNMLLKEHKEVVSRLAGILRLADNLDRGHRGKVDRLRLIFESSVLVTLQVEAHDDVSMELQHATSEKELFQDAFALTLHLQQVH